MEDGGLDVLLLDNPCLECKYRLADAHCPFEDNCAEYKKWLESYVVYWRRKREASGS